MVAPSVAPLLLLNFSDLSSVAVVPGLGTEVCRNCKYSHNGRSFSHLLPQLTFECLIFVSCMLNKRSLASVADGPVLEVMQPCMYWSENLSVCALSTEVCRNCKYSHNGKSFSHLLPQPTFECLIFVSYILNKRSLASTDDGLVLEVTQPCNDSKQKKNCWFNFWGENLFLDGCATVSIKSYMYWPIFVYRGFSP